jgi:ribosomal protein L9
MEITEIGNNDNNQPMEPSENMLTNKMTEKYGERNSKHALRPRQPRDYSHLHTTLESTVMTQHAMKKGLKIFGDAGTQAVLKELKELHNRKVEKKRALRHLMFH